MDAIRAAFPEKTFGEEMKPGTLGFGSTIFAVKPGDGSAREQAASCQKVLGGWANIANEYATKRYRSNLINWGMLPFVIPEERFRSRIWIICFAGHPQGSGRKAERDYRIRGEGF